MKSVQHDRLYGDWYGAWVVLSGDSDFEFKEARKILVDRFAYYQTYFSKKGIHLDGSRIRWIKRKNIPYFSPLNLPDSPKVQSSLQWSAPYYRFESV